MKFKIGEVCECFMTRDDIGYNGWVECEIMGYGLVTAFGSADYRIRIPGVYHKDPSVLEKDHWGADESELRKKKPPEEEDHIPEVVRNIFRVPTHA